MREGELTGALEPADYTEEKLLKLAMVQADPLTEAAAAN